MSDITGNLQYFIVRDMHVAKNLVFIFIYF